MKARDIISEGTYVGGHDPFNIGTPKEAGEIVRRLALKEISFEILCHGNNPSHTSLKNAIYLTVKGSDADYQYAKDVVDLLNPGK